MPAGAAAPPSASHGGRGGLSYIKRRGEEEKQGTANRTPADKLPQRPRPAGFTPSFVDPSLDGRPLGSVSLWRDDAVIMREGLFRAARAEVWILGSLVAIVGLTGWLIVGTRHAGPRPVRVLCAAVLRPAVAEAAGAFERHSHLRVRVEYGGSGALLASLRLAGRGDVYLPADASYLDDPQAAELFDLRVPLATLRPVIAVPQGAAKVRSLDDLLLEDVRLALADPDTAAIGRVVRRRLRGLGLWDALRRRARVIKPTVTDVANDVRLGVVDAAIVWNATVRQIDGLAAVHDPRLDDVHVPVEGARMRGCEHPAGAERFLRFLADGKTGGAILRRWGFEAVSETAP